MTWASVQFRINGRYVSLGVPLADVTRLRKMHPQTAIDQLAAREERRMWRALILLVKAKMEAIDAGISTFDREFLADLLLPDGERFFEAARIAIESAYKTGTMPALLPEFAGRDR